MKAEKLRKASAAVMSAALLMNSSVYSTAVVTAADAPLRFEFEDAEITGDVTVIEDKDASGGSALKMTDSGTITLSVDVETGGPYRLTFYAFGIGTDKQQNLSVNGSSQGAIGIPKSDEYQAVELTAIPLKAGKNSIVIEKSWGWSQFDYLTAELMESAKIEAKQVKPCDQLATVETQSLMAYLSEVYGKYIISGQQEIYSGGPHGLETEFEYLKDTTGHYPAIRGFDYGNFCCPLYGSDDGSTDRVINWVKNKGGIATASYHINVPKDFASYTLGTRMDWSNSTYTAKETDFSPSKAAEAGTKENEYYLSTLRTLAKEFNKLEAEGIPVIWRPLHEAEGGGGEEGSWFWWGREGSAAYKKLWIYTYETLTNELNCHNLIWEWNSYNFATSKDWYPGDAYVDIIGYDKYSCTDWTTGSARNYHNDSPFSSTFYGIMEKYDSAKMVAMAENDCFSTPDKLQEEKAGWLYFCTWYDGGSDNNNYVSNPTFNTKEDTIAMYQSDYCITLDELPKDLYNKSGITPPDPSKTTTSTTTATTTADPNATTTTTAYSFSIQKKSVTIPERPQLAISREMTIVISGAPGASIGGAVGYGTSADDWKNIEWSGQADSDGKLTVHVDIDEIPASFTSCEAQVWWSNVWNDATKKAVDQPYTIDSCKVHYLMGGALEPVWGDANCDRTVDMADAVLIMQSISNPNKYGLNGTDKNHITSEGQNLADVDGYPNGVTSADAARIQQFLLGKIDNLAH